MAEKPHSHALDEQLLRFDYGRGVPRAGKEVHRGPEGGLVGGTRVQIPNLPECVATRSDRAYARLLPFRVQPRSRRQEVRFYPSSKTCSGCGHRLDALPLSVRSWDCPACGAHHDRDVNAARNILTEGKRILSNMEGTAGHAGTGAAVVA